MKHEYVQIEVHNSSIGLEGLPLNLWTYHTFKIIGHACGGFIEVAKETLEQAFLRYAKIKS